MNKALALALFVLAGHLAAQTPLRVAAIEYPPYLGADGTTGLTYDLFRAALGPAYQVTFDVLPPARASGAFAAGQYPATVFNLDFSQVPGAVQVPMLNTRLVFFSRADRPVPRWTKLADLRGRSLAIPRRTSMPGGAIHGQLEKAGLQLVETDGLDQAFAMLALGRFDMVLAESLAGATAVRQKFADPALFAEVEPAFLTLSGGPWFNIQVPGAAQALEDFRKGLAAIGRDGTSQAILEKYYGRGRVPPGMLVP